MTGAAETSLDLDPSTDRFTFAAKRVCFVGLGGFLLWAAFAPLEEGVAARGQIVVETDRQTVQHLEGGIIRELRVREGSKVKAGDPLIVLEETSTLAGRDLVVQEYAALAATAQRLSALQGDADAPEFSVLSRLTLGDKERADILERERSLFQKQRQTLAADLAVLSSRRDAARATEASRTIEIGIVTKAMQAAREELAVRREMFAEQLARLDQVTAAEREAARLEAEIARLTSDRAEAAALAVDLEAQIDQTKARFAEEVGSALLKTRVELLSAEEKLRAAQDMLDRSTIRSPVDGEILNLRFTTLGGVVRPGEAILEVIPAAGGLTASVKIRPVDRASVFDGQIVRTQLSAYRSWRTPRLEGRVAGVSADLKSDPETSAVYYDARISVPDEELARLNGLEALPGMPIDVFIYSGRRRTLLDYVLEPLGESLFRGLRSA